MQEKVVQIGFRPADRPLLVSQHRQSSHEHGHRSDRDLVQLLRGQVGLQLRQALAERHDLGAGELVEVPVSIEPDVLELDRVLAVPGHDVPPGSMVSVPTQNLHVYILPRLDPDYQQKTRAATWS
jgi:hypothetical protein